MEHLKLGDIVTLEENKDYVVCAVAHKNNFNYVYLITIDEPYKVVFAKEILHEKDFDLELVGKKEEKEELLELFKKELGELEI